MYWDCRSRASSVAELNINAHFPQYFLKALLISIWYMNFNRPADTVGIYWEQTEDVHIVHAFIQSFLGEKTMNCLHLSYCSASVNSLSVACVFRISDLFSISGTDKTSGTFVCKSFLQVKFLMQILTYMTLLFRPLWHYYWIQLITK